MWNFQYKHGDRPLEGYTIERAAGRGGFGEVYYAVSDTGRQVALKAVQGYEQIEVRGISQCMNLKNPHLVTIFDVRYNTEGRPFVIMEFVSGPSLRQLLDESPSGLGTQKSAFFLREIGKGLSFLHENGIVHRDLKPANIFYENGYVKIGDYGLSKMISPMQNSAQTVTVGTVHYMAPEIGAGKYDRSIDIYALGAVLYELLMGMVPFNGASPSEVLLKHLSSEPDTTGIAEPFATVIKKAMAKDPAQRYQTVQEMVEAVFGSEAVRQSVSVFAPEELSVVAGQVARKAGIGFTAKPPPIPPQGGTATATEPKDAWDHISDWAERFSEQVGKVGDRMAGFGGATAKRNGISSHTMAVPQFAPDPLPAGQRRLLQWIVSGALGILGAMIAGEHNMPFPLVLGFTATAILGGSCGIHLVARKIMPRLKNEPPMIGQLAAGGLASVLACGYSLFFWVTLQGHRSNMSGTWAGIVIPLFCMCTVKWAYPLRKHRVSFWDTAFLAGLFAYIVGSMFDGNAMLAAVVTGGISLATQVRSWWDPISPRPREKDEKSDFAAPAAPAAPAVAAAAPGIPVPPPAPGNPHEWVKNWSENWSKNWAAGMANGNKSAQPRYWSGVVPGAVRIIWLALTLLSFAGAMALLIGAGFNANDTRNFVPMLCFGLGFLFATVILLVQTCRKRYYGLWSYLFKPLLLMACLAAILTVSGVLGIEVNNDGSNVDGSTVAAATFFIVLAVSVGIVTLAIPGRRRLLAPADAAQGSDVPSANSGFRFNTRFRWPRPPRTARPLRMVGPDLFLSFLAPLVIIAAVLLTLGDRMNVTGAVLSGLPDRSFLNHLNSHVFAGDAAWPDLMSRVLPVLATSLAFVAIVALVMARREQGLRYILRGVIGVLLMVKAAAMMGAAFHSGAWGQIGTLANMHQSDAAIQLFMDNFESHQLMTAGIVFVAGVIVLSWGPRRRWAVDAKGAAA